MASTKSQSVSLADIATELRALRREVEMFIPSESVDEYANKRDILASYRDARRRIAPRRA